MKTGLAVIVGLLLLLSLALALVSATPSVRVDPPVKAIGMSTPVKVHIDAPHGARRVAAAVEQDGVRYNVYERRTPLHRLWFFRSHAVIDVIFVVGKNKTPALKEGKARLIVQAESNDFLGRSATAVSEVEVILKPPSVAADGAQHYINQGGSELVTFTVGGSWTEAGVLVGKQTFRSFPMPGKPNNERLAFFAYPWDLPEDQPVMVYARNAAGTEVHGHFWFKVFPKKFRTDEIKLTDAIMTRLVDQIEPAGTGDLLARFLRINGELRRANNQTLAELRLKTEPRMLWHGPFVQLSNSKVESHFADVRTYVYEGKKVDQQVHLGFDLAVTQHTPVLAANDGKVLWAAPLGIYGNCIVLDHGYGLQSIYGHLSSLGVKVGDPVQKGQEMGKSGATGLALGDHLHFSMQVDGVQVNPVEWWDEHWIHDRILSKLPAAP